MTHLIEAVEGRTLLSGYPADPSFGAGGVVSGLNGPMLVQSDGKILVDVNSSGTIVRLNADGSRDHSFNPAGVIDYWRRGAARQADGKMLLLSGGVTRYNTGGSIDTTFGNDGSASPIGNGNNVSADYYTPQDIAVQGNQILVGGIINRPPDQDGDELPELFLVTRLNSDGTFDAAFGARTQVITQPRSQYGDITLNRLAVTSSGEIVGVGTHAPGGSGAGAVVLDFGPNSSPANDNPPKDLTPAFAFADMTPQPGGTVLALGQGSPSSSVGAALIVQTPPQVDFAKTNTFFIRLPNGSYLTQADYIALAPNGDVLVSSISDNEILRLVPAGAQVLPNTIMGSINPIDPTNPWQAYLDLNNDGIPQANEPVATADANGNFAFGNVAPGNYIVREIRHDGYTPTKPAGEWPAGDYPVTIGSGPGASGLDFSNVSAVISGNVGLDAGPGKPPAPLEGVTVYLDQNNNGRRDTGEPEQVTNAAGDYQFDSLPTVQSGAALRMVVPQGTVPVTPFNASYSAPFNIGVLNGSSFIVKQMPGQTVDVTGSPAPARPPGEPSEEDEVYYCGDPVDLNFGSNGVAALPPGPMQLQSDGRLLIDVNGSGTIERFNSDGTRDNTFDPSGVLDTWKQNYSGRSLVFSDGVLTRYNTDGSVDATFGAGGHVTNFNFDPNYTGFIPGAVISTGNSILVVGTVNPNPASPNFVSESTNSFATEWLNSDGTYNASSGIKVVADDPAATKTIVGIGYNILIGYFAGAFDSDGNIDVIRSIGFQFSNAPITVQHLPFKGTMTFISSSPDQTNRPWTIMTGQDSASGRSWIADLEGNHDFLVCGPATADDPGIASFNNATVATFTPDAGFYISNAQGRTIHLLPPTTKAPFFAASPDMIFGRVYLWPGAPQWQVYVDANDDGAYESGEKTAFTDANGNYILRGLTPGTYRVREVQQSGFMQVEPAGLWPAGYVDVQITANNVPGVGGINFANVPSPISGRISRVSTSGGPSAPLAGVFVYIDSNNDGTPDNNEPLANTNSSGDYAFATLPSASSYIVRAIAPPGLTQQTPAGGGAMSAAGQSDNSADFSFTASGSGGSTGGPSGGNGGGTGSTGGGGSTGATGGGGGGGTGSTGGAGGTVDSGNPGSPAGGATTPPTNLAGFKALLAQDRAALSAAQKHQKLQLASLKATLRQDTRAMRVAQKHLTSSNRLVAAAQRAGDSAGQAAADQAAQMYQAQVDQMTAAVDADQSALRNLLDADASEIKSAKTAMSDDAGSFKLFLRSQKKK